MVEATAEEPIMVVTKEVMFTRPVTVKGPVLSPATVKGPVLSPVTIKGPVPGPATVKAPIGKCHPIRSRGKMAASELTAVIHMPVESTECAYMTLVAESAETTHVVPTECHVTSATEPSKRSMTTTESASTVEPSKRSMAAAESASAMEPTESASTATHPACIYGHWQSKCGQCCHKHCYYQRFIELIV